MTFYLQHDHNMQIIICSVDLTLEVAMKFKNNDTGKIWDQSYHWFKSYGQNVSKEAVICGAGVRPTFGTEPEPNVRLSSMENGSGSQTVLLSLV